MKNRTGIFYRTRPRRCRLCFHRTHAVQTNGGYEVHCPSCGLHSREFPKRRQAVMAWNVRA